MNNTAHLVPRPEGAWPKAPAGFKVELYAGGDAPPMQRSEAVQQISAPAQGSFKTPRLIRTAPNGDLFLADSGAGTILVLRGVGANGKAVTMEKFATGLDHPFGIAFYPAVDPKYVYVGNATTIQRFPYHSGDLHATAPAETIVPDIPGYAQLTGGGHWTRDVVFSLDGKRMLVSVGSGSNVDDSDTHPGEFHRADVLQYTPEGKFVKVYASGIRNCVGEAINPTTGSLWCSTNERDGLGDNLVPDYITSVPEDSFFGWPWFYMGGHQDPRLKGKHPELQAKVRTPDVILQPHFASLEMTFYPTRNSLENLGRPADVPGQPPMKGGMELPLGIFPGSYVGDAFAAEHGSWNRSMRSGYEVIRVPMRSGKATGEYEDFLTGFVTADGKVWGRPVGVTIAKDGSMFVVDDGSRSVWHVTYVGAQQQRANGR